jgi:hypothetical protein
LSSSVCLQTPQTNSSPWMLVFLDRQRGREVSLEFRKDNPKEASIPKTVFPGLIKRMIDKLKPKNHPPSVFRKCSLWPRDPNKGFERIRHILSTDSIAQKVNYRLLKILEAKRFGTMKQKKPKARN